jgi:hypothetical protein
MASIEADQARPSRAVDPPLYDAALFRVGDLTGGTVAQNCGPKYDVCVDNFRCRYELGQVNCLN